MVSQEDGSSDNEFKYKTLTVLVSQRKNLIKDDMKAVVDERLGYKRQKSLNTPSASENLYS